jgi:hypothetical protein
MMLPQQAVESFAIDVSSLSGPRNIPRIAIKDTAHVQRLEQIDGPLLRLRERQFV